MESDNLGRVVLLGDLRFERGATVVNRFRSQKFAALLAYLALFPRRVHTREELADLLWPEAEIEVARTNLRTALASLRRQLEPPGVTPGAVLVTEGRSTVRLAGVETDVARFDRLCAAAARPGLPAPERARLLTEAVAVYGGPLLPGSYETWALTERDRLAGAFVAALRGLTAHHEAAGDRDTALDFARRAASADPLLEDAHADVLRLLVASGQGAAARRHWDELTALFERELGMEPSPELRDILSAKAVPKGTLRLASPPTTRASSPPVAAPAPPATVAPQPMETAPLHLPLTLTHFFGREAEIAEAGECLRGERRLVTLTGPGGSGKTRLAIETARGTADSFPGGVWFVPLGDLNDPAGWLDAVADALGLPPEASSDALTRIAAFLARPAGPALLVLDNCEHLAEATASHVSALLARVPGLSCLVTSRQRLMLDGEAELPVPPLATPAKPGTPERLLEFPAVQLFVSRAQAARTDFALNARNADAVAHLCHRLEGIPLALELAAAWAQMLTPAQMLTRLERRFELLVARRRDVPARHRTLRATIAWSYESLPPDIQAFWARLSVFSGGWTLDVAEAVCGGTDALTALTELRERSLITAATEGEDIRFRMLETLREFAGEQLSAEDRSEAQRRHAAYFLRLGEEIEPRTLGTDAKVVLDQLAIEMENIRAVLSRAAAREVDAMLGLRLVGAVGRFWLIRGRTREGLARYNELLALPENEGVTSARAKALRAAGVLANGLGELTAAAQYYEEALALFRALGDTRGESNMHINLGNSAYYRSDFDTAQAWYTSGLALARALRDNPAMSRLLSNLGFLSLLRGDYEAALRYSTEARDIFAQEGDREGQAFCLLNIGGIHMSLGQDEVAQSELESCLAQARELGYRRLEGMALGDLGALAREHGLTAKAALLLDQAHQVLSEIEDTHWSGNVANELGLLAQATGDLDAAAEQHARALALWTAMGDRQGIATTLHCLAQLALRRAQPEHAARLLGAFEAVRQPLGSVLTPRQRSVYEATIHSTRAALGEAAYAEYYASGRTAPVEQTLETVAHEKACR